MKHRYQQIHDHVRDEPLTTGWMIPLNKGNNKITEHRTIKLINQQTDKISQLPENWENHNGPDLVEAFPKKWWVESDFTAPNLPLPLWLKGSGCHYNSILTILGQNIYFIMSFN